MKQLADFGDTSKTYYISTTLGEKLLAGLYDVALPPLTMQPVVAPVTRSRIRALRVEGN